MGLFDLDPWAKRDGGPREYRICPRHAPAYNGDCTRGGGTMQYYSAKDLASAFRTVRNNTIKIAEEIPEGHYGFRPAPDTRTVAETLAHIAAAPRWSKSMHSQRITHPDFATFRTGWEESMKYQATLTNKAQILEALRAGGEEFA